MNKRITAEMVVRALKALRRTVRVGEIARELGTEDTRAIATAARIPAADGRIAVRYPKRSGSATYRFIRLTAKDQPND